MEKKVLLFSGGFDSLIQEWFIKPDVLLYVDMKTSYSAQELLALDRLPQSYKDRLIVKELPLGEYERENKYLPYRNLILAAIAMQYGQHVYFGFNYDDKAPDKDAIFMRQLGVLFRHLNKNCIGDMQWETKNFSFNAPFKDLTKTEIVSKALNEGMPPKLIQSIRSCYSGTSAKGCGCCPVCASKAEALLNNGIYEEGIFDADVLPILERRYNRIVKNASYTEKSKSETLKAIKALKDLRKQS